MVKETMEDFAARPELYQRLGLETPEKTAAYIRKHSVAGDTWMNDKYTVCVYPPHQPTDADWPLLIHLSIKRIDREPIHDWRELQEIKNQLVGPENEAVELYPAESRLVDSANQFHLFALADPKLRFPFGFTQRFVDHNPGKLSKVKQRPRA